MPFPLIPVAAAAGVLIFMLASGKKKKAAPTPTPYVPIAFKPPVPPGPVPLPPPPPPPPPAPTGSKDTGGTAWGGEPFGGYGTPSPEPDTSTPPPKGSAASEATIIATADNAGFKSGRIDGLNDGEAGDAPHPKADPPATEGATYTMAYVSGYNRGYGEGHAEGHHTYEVKKAAETGSDDGGETNATGLFSPRVSGRDRVAFWRHRR